MNSYIPIHNFVVSNFVVLEINFLFELGSIVICSGDQAQNNIPYSRCINPLTALIKITCHPLSLQISIYQHHHTKLLSKLELNVRKVSQLIGACCIYLNPINSALSP